MFSLCLRKRGSSTEKNPINIKLFGLETLSVTLNHTYPCLDMGNYKDLTWAEYWELTDSNRANYCIDI